VGTCGKWSRRGSHPRETESVLAHNERAAATWDSGGRDYERISELSADALRHVVDRLLPQPGERALDVATGTGWTARLLADCGAVVSAVDIGAGVIAFHEQHRGNLGIAFPRDYLVTISWRLWAARRSPAFRSA
jgi:ubiquinone/menaquinone biosynthesis C-methylase UbiE